MRLTIGLLLAGSVVVATGCGRASAQSALYTGRVADRVVDASGVTAEPSLPAGALFLGDVVSRCRADGGVVSIDDESLADVDCSQALLVAALREKAAAVGGTLLVGLRCVTSPESRGELLSSEVHSCSAMVGGPAANARGKAPDAPRDVAAFAPPYASPAEAFRVSVTVVPAVKAPLRRRAVASDAVAELAVVPPGRVVVGDIVASCSDDCDRAVVRHAVRAAAGRVGGSDVVGIACVRRDDGFICTGRAARPEIDELSRR